MKKIIPFKKDIIFKSNVSEITCICLEHTLDIKNQHMVEGKFTVSGEYKISDSSVQTEDFSYDLPFSINMDEKYVLDDAIIDIEDFYYEIINDNVLSVNIEVLIDKIEECEVIELEEVREEEPIRLEKEEDIMLEEIDMDIRSEECEVKERCIEDESIPDKITSLFDRMDDSVESYKSYSIYIVREGDTLEMILEKYGITKENLEDYNDLSEIKLGDKIIIPS